MLRFFAEQMRVACRERETRRDRERRRRSCLARSVAIACAPDGWMFRARTRCPDLNRGATATSRRAEPRRSTIAATASRRDEHGLSRRAGRGAPALDLRLRDVAGGDHGRQHPGEPSLVVRHPEVLGRRQNLDAMAKRIEVPQPAAGSQHARRARRRALPRARGTPARSDSCRIGPMPCMPPMS